MDARLDYLGSPLALKVVNHRPAREIPRGTARRASTATQAHHK
jgi:hypothetical protein